MTASLDAHIITIGVNDVTRQPLVFGIIPIQVNTLHEGFIHTV